LLRPAPQEHEPRGWHLLPDRRQRLDEIALALLGGEAGHVQKEDVVLGDAEPLPRLRARRTNGTERLQLQIVVDDPHVAKSAGMPVIS
jgi:hypothetical protein